MSFIFKKFYHQNQKVLKIHIGIIRGSIEHKKPLQMMMGKLILTPELRLTPRNIMILKYFGTHRS